MNDLLQEAQDLALRGQNLEAAGVYESILEPGASFQADLLHNLTAVLVKGRKLDRALHCARAAAFFAPHLARSWLSLNHIENKLGLKEDALASLYRALEIEPDNISIQETRLFHLASTLSPLDYRKEAEAWWAALPPAPRTYSTNLPPPGTKIRIGYVSGDFRLHVMDRFIEAILRHHDYDRFEVFCFDNTPKDARKNCSVRERLLNLPGPQWIDVADAETTEATQMIVSSKIDVLFDLSGIGAHNRLDLFRRRPAPLQLTGIGYLNTVGTCFDYRIADVEHQSHYLEPLWKLPSAAAPLPLCPELPVTPLPALRNGFVTFGYVNGLHKLTLTSIQSFVRLLQQLPSSRLLMMIPGASDGETVRAILRRFDPVQEQIIFTESQGGAAFCNIFKDIDIALDPAPYGGCTTTFDTLYHGVPVAADASDRRLNADAHRLQAAFRPLFYDKLEDDAFDLASDLPQLASMRGRLRSWIESHAAGQPVQWVKNLEGAYFQMIEKRSLAAAA